MFSVGRAACKVAVPGVVPQGSVQGQISFKLQTSIDLITLVLLFCGDDLLRFNGFKYNKALQTIVAHGAIQRGYCEVQFLKNCIAFYYNRFCEVQIVFCSRLIVLPQD
ncbi:TPA: hypothetical protein JBA65_16705 [Legionella pneumophila subsp. pneumophila]|nr:hypothetical protein [Legionella pneumophila subsp. pneumophila]HAT8869638.1 hypothetical protein [Legionella pneumophila subsp. pneumophila]